MLRSAYMKRNKILANNIRNKVLNVSNKKTYTNI